MFNEDWPKNKYLRTEMTGYTIYIYLIPEDQHRVFNPVQPTSLDPRNPVPSGQSMSLIQAERAPPSGPQFSGRVIQVKGLRSPRSTHWLKARSVLIALPI